MSTTTTYRVGLRPIENDSFSQEVLVTTDANPYTLCPDDVILLALEQHCKKEGNNLWHDVYEATYEGKDYRYDVCHRPTSFRKGDKVKWFYEAKACDFKDYWGVSLQDMAGSQSTKDHSRLLGYLVQAVKSLRTLVGSLDQKLSDQAYDHRMLEQALRSEINDLRYEVDTLKRDSE